MQSHLLCNAAQDLWQEYLCKQKNMLPLDWAALSIALFDRFGSKLKDKKALADILTLQ